MCDQSMSARCPQATQAEARTPRRTLPARQNAHASSRVCERNLQGAHGTRRKREGARLLLHAVARRDLAQRRSDWRATLSPVRKLGRARSPTHLQRRWGTRRPRSNRIPLSRHSGTHASFSGSREGVVRGLRWDASDPPEGPTHSRRLVPGCVAAHVPCPRESALAHRCAPGLCAPGLCAPGLCAPGLCAPRLW